MNLKQQFFATEAISPAVLAITSIANSTDPEESFTRLGLTKPGATIVAISPLDKRGWFRAGGEAYILPFELTTTDAEARTTNAKFILKSCMINAAPTDPEGPSLRLLARRRQLEENGIPAPHLFGYRDSTFLEEFIDKTVEDALVEDREKTLCQAASYYGTMAKLGYDPMVCLHDYRWNGKNLLAVDFGADLGSPGDKPTSLWSKFEKEAKKVANATSEELVRCRPYYEDSCGENSVAIVPSAPSHKTKEAVPAVPAFA